MFSTFKAEVPHEPHHMPSDHFRSPVDKALECIASEIIDDAIIELCFEVHKEALVPCGLKKVLDLVVEGKSSEPANPLLTEESSYVKCPNVKPKTPLLLSTCPICAKTIASTMFARHLGECMGYSKYTLRGTIREAARKKIEETFAFCEDDSDSDCDSSKKKSKRSKIKRKQSMQAFTDKKFLS